MIKEDRKIRGFSPSNIRFPCDYCGDMFPPERLTEMPDIVSNFDEGHALYCVDCLILTGHEEMA